VAASVAFGFWREFDAGKAVERLLARVTIRVRVLRDGKAVTIPSAEVVPGDVVLLGAGSLVPADGILLEATDFFACQAVLTGESLPVEKAPGPVRPQAGLAERTNFVYMGTSIRSGTAKAVMVRTGPATVYGEIAGRLKLRPPETGMRVPRDRSCSRSVRPNKSTTARSRFPEDCGGKGSVCGRASPRRIGLSRGCPKRIGGARQAVDRDRLQDEERHRHFDDGQMEGSRHDSERNDQRGGARRRMRGIQKHHERPGRGKRERRSDDAVPVDACHHRRRGVRETGGPQRTVPAGDSDGVAVHRIPRAGRRKERRRKKQEGRWAKRRKDERRPRNAGDGRQDGDGDESVRKNERSANGPFRITRQERRQPETGQRAFRRRISHDDRLRGSAD